MAKNTHSLHSCQAIVVSCIDFRLGKYLSKMDEKIKGGYDSLSIAGAVKNLDFVIEQIELSRKLHSIKEVYLINHEDCGAYGKAGTRKKHRNDLTRAKKIIREKYPDLTVFLIYLKLDGSFERVD